MQRNIFDEEISKSREECQLLISQGRSFLADVQSDLVKMEMFLTTPEALRFLSASNGNRSTSNPINNETTTTKKIK